MGEQTEMTAPQTILDLLVKAHEQPDAMEPRELAVLAHWAIEVGPVALLPWREDWPIPLIQTRAADD